MEHIIVERDPNKVTWIQINREPIRNALNLDVMAEIHQALDNVEKDDSRVVIITGAGDRAFCSGGDLTSFQHLHTKEQAADMLFKMGQLLERIMFFPKITVAALNGTAVGGGSELAVACDFRVAVPHAKMGFIQGKLGITTGWGGGTILLHRIQPSYALEMLASARIYPVQELTQSNLVQAIITEPLRMGVLEWLSPILRQNENVLHAYKQRLLDQFDQVRIQKNIKKEIDECSSLWATKEHHEAVKGFLTGK
ncbi:enoyl-CoA hydratase/isomerase family protein [Halalkalibacter krulwichiae]|uniref:Ethylmalonyl-CoA decarboxylase n=1 Tax=Halalkalibacter krulwichiae TaxID=199441 RepID=A0A1X9MCH5_9BACI|nr:enoyl-CoA hydratase/isomerase family protein [Halalkalibacter krulwichiae]ARK31108.1 2,3-dehydroadipyl-CoA hydratase [Halalkalibacter krulwichiae]